MKKIHILQIYLMLLLLSPLVINTYMLGEIAVTKEEERKKKS